MFSSFFWLIISAILIILIASFICWKYINFTWLQKTASAIVILYPFEYLPTIDFGPATLKPSFLATLFGVWVLFILILKKDKNVLNTKILNLTWWFAAFVFASLPSFFIAQNATRFWTTLIATTGVFASSLIIAHFSKNPVKDAKRLVFAMLFVCFFAAFQFVADMLGLPQSVTQLRVQYTKIIFGFPRVHATALEPLLFAGMLYFPIMMMATFFAAKQQIWHFPTKVYVFLENLIQGKWIKSLPFKISRFTQNFTKNLLDSEKNTGQFSNMLGLLFVSAIFISTISKGAYFALVVSIPFLIFISIKQIDYRKLITMAIIGLTLFSTMLGVLALRSQNVRKSLIEVYNNFYYTILGQTGTLGEREDFQNVAWYLAKNNPLTGVGGGNFADTAARLLPQYSTANPGSLIVNNVYLEIFAEQGLITISIFMLMLAYLALRSFKYLTLKTEKNNQKSTQKYLVILSLTFSLVCYAIQWTSFSPIYITPVFILIGLLEALFRQKEV